MEPAGDESRWQAQIAELHSKSRKWWMLSIPAMVLLVLLGAALVVLWLGGEGLRGTMMWITFGLMGALLISLIPAGLAKSDQRNWVCPRCGKRLLEGYGSMPLSKLGWFGSYPRACLHCGLSLVAPERQTTP